MYIAIIICVGLPFFILWLTYKSLTLRKIGGIIIAYVLACVLSLSGVISDDVETHKIQTLIAQITVPLAIPLLLFSADIRSWTKLAPSFIKATICGFLACGLSVFGGFMILGHENSQLFSSVGGMLTGLYTGGNANLASLKIALNVDDSTYLLVSAYSTLASAIYLFLIIIVGKRLTSFILPKFDYNKTSKNIDVEIKNYDNELFFGLFKRENIGDFFRGLLLSILIIALSAGISLTVPSNMFQTVFILLITLFSLIASLNKKVRNINRTFEAGTFFIIIFSVAVASQVSLNSLMNVDGKIFWFTVFVTLACPIFHILLCALLRVDVDTVLTASISLICSPPFAPVMGGVLKNKSVIGPGIAVGLFGYAAGTYFGFLTAKLLLLM